MIAMYPLESLQMLIFSPLAVLIVPRDKESPRKEISMFTSLRRKPDEGCAVVFGGEPDRCYTQAVIPVRDAGQGMPYAAF